MSPGAGPAPGAVPYAPGAGFGPGAVLGIPAKSSATFKGVIDEKTAEYQRFTLDERRREYVQESGAGNA